VERVKICASFSFGPRIQSSRKKKNMIRPNRRLGLFLAAQLLTAVWVWGQGAYKIEPVTTVPSDIPKALQGVLQPEGTRVVGAKGPVCEVWVGKAVAQGTGGSPDAVYPSLGVGTLVGVLHFPTAGSDFRGQAIKPGYYTLRYALLPQDGNHMGVNPYRDFLLLSPVAADTQIDKPLQPPDLYKLSRQASGTNHPAVMSLVPTAQGATFPSVGQDDQGHTLLQVKLGTTGGGLPIALVVVGQAAAT
jgi:hypothetical protein